MRPVALFERAGRYASANSPALKSHSSYSVD
jgi:hypothetical protein